MESESQQRREHQNAGTCPFCNQKAGILSREHQGCRRTFHAGWDEMVRLASGAARSHEFHANSLQVSLAEIARRSYGDGSTVNQALEEGWKQEIAHAMADGIMTQDEEAHSGSSGTSSPQSPWKTPNPTGTDSQNLCPIHEEGNVNPWSDATEVN